MKSTAVALFKKTILSILVCASILTIYLLIGTYLVIKEYISISTTNIWTITAYALVGVIGSLFDLLLMGKENIKMILIRIGIIGIIPVMISLIMESSEFKLHQIMSYLVCSMLPLLVQNRVRHGNKKIKYKYKNGKVVQKT